MHRFFFTLCAAAAIALFAPAQAQVTAVPNAMTFQGRLAKPDGTPVANGTYSVRFSLWSAVTGGTEKWNQTVAGVSVRNGTFAVTLSGFGSTVFNADNWLEIKIGTNLALTPRQQLVSIAYAMKANSVKDGSITGASIASGTITADKFTANLFNTTAWLLGGNSATNPATNFLGTTDNQPFNLRVNNRQAMRYSYTEHTATAGSEYRSINVLGGSEINNITTGVVGATIAGGGLDYFTRADFPNRVTADFGTIGGGLGNTASGDIATVAGGNANTASGSVATVGGGIFNTANNYYATISGGESNFASGFAATVGGGWTNNALNEFTTISGGEGNNASGTHASIGGGSANSAGSDYGIVAGGRTNNASGPYAFIGGGQTNRAQDFYATIGGGDTNTIYAGASWSTIGGGSHNIAGAQVTTIGGGDQNYTGATWATVGGGLQNQATGLHSSVGGGYINQAIATYAAIPGGYYNQAGGNASLAAGYRAVANMDGAFVWADYHEADFNASAANQFCIRAYGGMVFEAGGSMALYTSSTAGEKNRSLFLLNSPQSPSASGLKAGGILCADSYGYAYPGKNDMVVKGTLGVGYPNPAPYTFAVNGSIYTLTGYYGSDARWKNNIQTFPNALDAVLSLRGVTFDWRKNDYPNQNFPAGTQIGFIAQEVEKVLPELVSTGPDGYKAVAYANFAPVLVEAVKQQQTKISTQQTAILTQQKQIDELKVRNAWLEAQVAEILALLKQPKR